MEEEINYSTLVFKNSAPPPKKEKEEETTYSAIKTTASVTTETKEKEEETIYSGIKPEESVTNGTKVEATKSSTRLLLVFLGILCVLLVASVIVIIIYFTMVMKHQEANLSDLTAKNQQLIMEKRNLENQTEELTVQKRILENQTEELTLEKTILVNQTEQLTVEKRVLENQTEQLIVEKRVLVNQTEQLSKDRENLNRTLGVILKFDNFPVQDFCPNKKCEPCQKGWLLYKQKCYLFHKGAWKSWHQSREHCQNRAADLVVIDDLQEQEFISSHSEDYHSIYRGYWLGLRKTNNNWSWVDGRLDALGYWMAQDSVGSSNSFALLIPRRKVTQNWNKNKSAFNNRFICERETLIRSD